MLPCTCPGDSDCVVALSPMRWVVASAPMLHHSPCHAPIMGRIRPRPNTALPQDTAAPPILPEHWMSTDHSILSVQQWRTSQQNCGSRPSDPSFQRPAWHVRPTAPQQRIASSVQRPQAPKESVGDPSIMATPYARRLKNGDEIPKHAKLTHGPNGDDSTKEDEDTPERAPQSLLSAKQTFVLTE